jgi:hypothetical protein
MGKRPSLAGSVKRAEAKPEENTGKVKVTFELEEPIYTRFRVFAAREHLRGREVLTEALKAYLAQHDTAAEGPQRRRR